MTKIVTNRTTILLVLLLSIIAVICYVISLKVAYPLFQNTRLTEPLASLQALFPLYYVAIVLIAAAGLLRLVSAINSRALDLWLLVLFALMLWYTPHALAGATYQLDGLKFMGVANRIPELLAREPVVSSMTGYGRHYPTSFIFHWICIKVIGVEPFFYLNILFPLLYLCLFVLLFYLFISGLFNNRIAFFSLLLGIPGLHYMQLHPSPHTIGSLLMVTAMVFMLKRGAASIIALVTAVLATVISHPISPLILLIFLAIFFLTSLLRERGTRQATLVAVTVFCFLGWLLVRLFSIIPAPEALTTWTSAKYGADLLKSVLPDDFSRTTHYLLGVAFVYSPIYNLNKGIYFLYAAVAMLMMSWTVTVDLLRLRNIKTWVMKLGGLTQSQLFLLIAAPLLLILTVLLGEYELGEYGLIERSLTVIVLALSTLIASVLLRLLSHAVLQKIKVWFYVILVVLLTLSFPIVSYSKDAYTSIPESEKSAVGFVEANQLITVKSDQRVIIPSFQLAYWSWDIKPFRQYDVFIFQSTTFYYKSMRIDLSFTDNEFVRVREAIVKGRDYNKLYNNPTTEVFLQKNSISSD